MQTDLRTTGLGRFNTVAAAVGISDCPARMNYMDTSEPHRAVACPADLQRAFQS